MKLLALLLVPCAALVADENPALGMRAAADAFVSTLDDAARAMACLPFEDAQRENFRYTPRDRSGVPLKKLDEAGRAAAMKLLESALSEKGKHTALEILALEGILGKLEGNPDFRDPDRYFVTLFGKPGDPRWAWKFEGHHLSVNYTVVDREVAATPMFFGLNPAEVREGPRAGLRVLAAEEDLAMALARALVADGKDAVLFSDKAPREILTGEQRKVDVLDPVGVPAGEMADDHRAALMELIDTYLNRHHRVIAAAERKLIERAGIDGVRFGWAGGTRRGGAWYYRIQGPTFLMEAANSQNQANHVHTTWRSFDRDFGRDLLREHVLDEHPRAEE